MPFESLASLDRGRQRHLESRLLIVTALIMLLPTSGAFLFVNCGQLAPLLADGMGVTIVDLLGHAPWLVTDAARASEFSLDAPADAAPSELCSVVLPQLCSTLHFVVAAEPGLIGTGNAAPRVAVCACAVRSCSSVVWAKPQRL